MPAQKSRKGRLTAAEQLETQEVSRRRNGPPSLKRGAWRGQQFGGVAQRKDDAAYTVSGRTQRAIVRGRRSS